MEYTVQKLASLAGISARTLRFYDEIGLLRPARISSSGYRIYGRPEVDRLQQILFFREMGLELTAIAGVLDSPSYDRLHTLREHLLALESRKAQIDLLIGNVQKTILMEEGETTMSDKEKFEGFKRDMVAENERKYGQEIREKYGEDTVNESNARMMNMSREQYEAMQAVAARVQELLETAVRESLPADGEAGREVALLHKQWLTSAWAKYAKEAHLGLTQMYLDDERFTAHYDKNLAGCAQFLHDAVHAWAGEL